MKQEKYDALVDYTMDNWNDIVKEFMGKYDGINLDDDITDICYNICDYAIECNNMSNEEMYNFGISKVRNTLNKRIENES